ncbi:MAG: hypothetical protein EA397_06560 [Deltaproteobacteria bacterium]|nr:MAG: hypothetical protein EA397_06560 [Deltaproteobacteria bacterium]
MLWLASMLPTQVFAADPDPDPGSETVESLEGDPASTPAATTRTSSRLTDEEMAARAERSRRNRELLSVEQDVSSLKERVFRSKATLRLLKELVIEGSTVGSRASIWHINKLSGAYTVESIQYFLDGKAVFSRTDTSGGLDKLRDVEIHSQTLAPGAHSLQVTMVLRGKGFGVFSYVRDYSFKIESNYGFTVEDGKITVIKASVNSQGGAFSSFVDRPDLTYTEVRESLRGD